MKKFRPVPAFATTLVLLSTLVAPATVPAAAGKNPASGRFKPQKKTKITTGSSQFGSILFNRRRQAIYLFDREKTGRSRCYGDCARAWPPVLTRGRPRARGKVEPKLLGTTKRRGGATQVTYAGRPLYYYAHEGPGQVFCNDVFQFGGTWLVLHPNGRTG